ncbi:SRPBCC domain-containing protein [Ferrovibrio terrae]|uniref:SRPBCC family protein n=1 Tax=Ferrovibrio terrae TaxID=2594003 RepID=UPI003137FCEB
MTAPAPVAPSLTLKRRIKAPPEKVFAAWTQPQLMRQWFAPAHAATLEVDCDLRIGGRYRVLMHVEDDGRDHEASGVYREIVPHERLVFTWTWLNRPEEGETLVTLHFRPDDGHTLFTLTHERFASEQLRDEHSNGWSGALDKLVQVSEA